MAKFWKNLGSTVGNSAKLYADYQLSALGMNNVIGDDAYKGDSAKSFRKASDVLGKVGQVALPIAANAVAGPMGGAVAGGLQQIGSQYNPQEEQPVDQTLPEYGTPMYQQPNMYGLNPAYMAYGGKMNKYAMGGMAAVEVEGKEVLRTPNGETEEVEGASHENGGVKTMLPIGTEVFSKRLKSASGKSFAKEASKYDTKKYSKILEDMKADSLKKKTAQIMFERNNEKLTELFEEQEAQKEYDLNKGMYAFGGSVKEKNGQLYMKSKDERKLSQWAKEHGMDKKKAAEAILMSKFNPNSIPHIYAKGGKVDDKQKALDSMMNLGIKYQVFAKGGSVPKYANGSTVTDRLYFNPLQDSNNLGGNTNYSNPLYFNSALDAQNVYGGLKGYSNPVNTTPMQSVPSRNITSLKEPAINNTIQSSTGILGQQPASAPTQGFKMSPGMKQGLMETAIWGIGNMGNLAYLKNEGKNYDKQNYYNYTPTYLDSTAALRDVKQSTAATREMIPGVSGGNSGLAIQSLLANRLAGDRNLDSTRQYYQNANAQIANQAGQLNLQNRYNVDNINAANKGQALTNYYQALGDTGVNTARQVRDIKTYGDQQSTDQQRFDWAREYYKKYGYYPDLNKQSK